MTRRQRRIGYVIAGAAAGALAYWLVFGPSAGWLIGPDLAQMTSKERTDSINAMRGLMGTVLGTTVVVIVAVPSVVKLFDDRNNQNTNWINAAVANLASESVTVRAGGLRALGRILRNSPEDRDTVIRTATGYLRSHGIEQNGDGVPDDIAAALAVLRDRGPAPRGKPDIIDLHGARLQGVDLSGFDLRHADLSGADLTGADLTDADLHGALMRKTRLIRANLTRTDLTESRAIGVVLTDSTLRESDLRGCDLTDADATGADFTGARLDDAVLVGARLQQSDLRAALGLTADRLRRARTDRGTGLPPGLGGEDRS